MFQEIRLDVPIPSCRCSKIIYDNGKWTYVYLIDTDNIISDDNIVEMIVYGHVGNLRIRKSSIINDVNSVNIKFTTLSEYKDILIKQREEDIEYRNKWLFEHLEFAGKNNKVIVNNIDYDLSSGDPISYIVDMESMNENYTIFSGR